MDTIFIGLSTTQIILVLAGIYLLAGVMAWMARVPSKYYQGYRYTPVAWLGRAVVAAFLWPLLLGMWTYNWVHSWK